MDVLQGRDDPLTHSEVQPVYSHKKWEVGPAALSAALDVLKDFRPHI